MNGWRCAEVVADRFAAAREHQGVGIVAGLLEDQVPIPLVNHGAPVAHDAKSNQSCGFPANSVAQLRRCGSGGMLGISRIERTSFIFGVARFRGNAVDVSAKEQGQDRGYHQQSA